MEGRDTVDHRQHLGISGTQLAQRGQQVVAQGDAFAERVGDVPDRCIAGELPVGQGILEVLPGEDPHDHVIRIDDGILQFIPMSDDREGTGQGRVSHDDGRIVPVGVLHRQALEHAFVGAVGDVLASPCQPLAVDRLGVHPLRHHIRQGTAEHEREDQAVVVGHFQDHEDGRERCVHGPADQRGHPHEPEGDWLDPEAGEGSVERHADGRPERPADDQRRREHSTHPASGQRQAGEGDLGHRQENEHPGRLAQDQSQIHALVSTAPQARLELVGNRADDHGREKQPQPGGHFGQPVVDVPDAPRVKHRHHAADHPEHGIKEKIAGRSDGIFGGDRDHEVIAQADAGDGRRRDAGHDHRGQPQGAEAPDDLFQGEEDSGDRRPERPRYARRGATSDQ